MKMTINMMNTETNAITDSLMAIANGYGVEIDKNRISKNVSEIRKSATAGETERFPGGTASISLKEMENDTREYTMTIDVEQEAFIEALSIGVKVAKVFAPVVHASTALANILKSVHSGLKDQMKDITRDFRERFVPAKSYLTFRVMCPEIELDEIIVAENNGFDSWNMVHTYRIGMDHEMDVIVPFFRKKLDEILTDESEFNSIESYKTLEEVEKDAHDWWKSVVDPNSDVADEAKTDDDWNYAVIVTGRDTISSGVSRSELHMIRRKSDGYIEIVKSKELFNSIGANSIDNTKLGHLLKAMFDHQRIFPVFMNKEDAEEAWTLTIQDRPLHASNDRPTNVSFVGIKDYSEITISHNDADCGGEEDLDG